MAIKVVRNVDRYRHAAEKEARLLTHLDVCKQADSGNPNDLIGSDNVISFLGSFNLPTGHYCLVFPPCGLSLFDFLRQNRFRPFFPQHIQHIALQLLQGVAFLHANGVQHGDVKPENILLAEPHYTQVPYKDSSIWIPNNSNIRIVDFGTAVHISQDKPAIVVSRSYRPPEVVLGIGWDAAVDLWAIGCVIMELYTGRRLFNVANGSDCEHLQMMEAMLGPLPKSMLNAPVVYPQTAATYSSPASSPVSNSNNYSSSMGLPNGQISLLQSLAHADPVLYNLVMRMLVYEPSKRITAHEALMHPYFNNLHSHYTLAHQQY